MQILLLDGGRDFQCRVAFEESAWIGFGPAGRDFEGGLGRPEIVYV